MARSFVAEIASEELELREALYRRREPFLQRFAGILQVGAVNAQLEIADTVSHQLGDGVDQTVQALAVDQLAKEAEPVALFGCRPGVGRRSARRRSPVVDQHDILGRDAPFEIALPQKAARRDEPVDTGKMRAQPSVPQKELGRAPLRKAQRAAGRTGAIAQTLTARPHHLPVGMTDRHEFMQRVNDARLRTGHPRQALPPLAPA